VKTFLVLLSIVVLLLMASCVLLSGEAPVALAFGWIVFPIRVLPRVTVDWPSVILGAAAVVLFALGVHWIGRSWRRSRPAVDRVPPAWKIRWSLSVVAIVFLLFASGIAIVGTVHQVAWLATTDSHHKEVLANQPPPNWNIKQIGLAASTYHDMDGKLPPGGSFTPAGGMLHSWETHILPYMWYDSRGIDRKKPWNDPVNEKYFKSVIPEFLNPDLSPPSLRDGDGYGLSHYSANIRVLGANRSMKLDEITNGTSNTILFGEVNANFQPWGHPVNWRDPVRGINRSPNGFGGPSSSGGVNFAMADGSIRFVSENVSPEVLRAMSNPRAEHPGNAE
jgi:prepilin-type processing-associated H-X9-DG protein